MTTMFFFLMPMIYLSGFIFPIENMPAVIQPFTYLIPLRYFLVIVRGIFLKGDRAGPAVAAGGGARRLGHRRAGAGRRAQPQARRLTARRARLLPAEHPRRQRRADDRGHATSAADVAAVRGPRLAAPDAPEQRHGIGQRQHRGRRAARRAAARRSARRGPRCRASGRGWRRPIGCAKRAVGTRLAIRNPIDRMLDVLKSSAIVNDTGAHVHGDRVVALARSDHQGERQRA